MRAILLALLALAWAAGAYAQDFKKMGKTAVELAPPGWKVEEHRGDLNRDGIADMMVLATPSNSGKIIIREEDGAVFDCNAPVLAIYWGAGAGYFVFYKQYSGIVPHREDEYVDVTVEPSITDKGCLRFATSTIPSAGTSETGKVVCIYRFQNGDFFKIGFASESYSRMSGEAINTSYNFNTNKKQTIYSNFFDKSVPKTEKWEDIARKPLPRLGSEMLDTWPD